MGRGCRALAVLALLAIGGAHAQPPAKSPPPKRPDTAPKPIVEPANDPTKASPALERELAVPKNGGAAPALPAVRLKGRVIAPDKSAAALLEIDPKTPPYLVTRGTTLVLPNNIRLRVLEVTAGEVRIEISPLNETIVLR